MIDLQAENTLPLNRARSLPWLKGRGGERLSTDSLRRWSQKGLRGVVLETVKLGGTTYTSTEAIVRFLDRLNAADTPATPPSDRRAREISEADARLDRAGIR